MNGGGFCVVQTTNMLISFFLAIICFLTTQGTLEKAFEDIRALAEEAGAPKGIEMLQARDKDKVILFALPGTTERLESGDFPPPPPPEDPPKED